MEKIKTSSIYGTQLKGKSMNIYDEHNIYLPVPGDMVDDVVKDMVGIVESIDEGGVCIINTFGKRFRSHRFFLNPIITVERTKTNGNEKSENKRRSAQIC